MPSNDGRADHANLDAAFIEAIPRTLRDRPQWICWKQLAKKAKERKARKLPIDPHSGRPASTTNARTWGTLEESCTHARSDDLSGIGFVFTAETGLVGIDLDHCRRPNTGVLATWAQDIIERLASYSEISPSGTGLHIIVKGMLPPGWRKKGHVEMYDRGRFFTVTGNRLASTPPTIEGRSEQLARLHAEIASHHRKARPKSQRAAPTTLSDDQIVARARSAKNGDKFARLWSGDTQGYPSPSEADLALCDLLAFWIGPDPTRIDQLFRRSNLMREKWDERRGASTYGHDTITTALAGRTAFHATASSSGATCSVSDADGSTMSARLLAAVHKPGIELFHDPSQEAFATIPVHQHQETHRLRDRSFHRWLGWIGYRDFGSAVPSQVLSNVLAALEATARFDCPERTVAVRIAGDSRTIELDLGREDWSVASITCDGWTVQPGSRCKFRRSKGMGALPVPARGGSIAELRSFINCSDPDWPLILGWLVAALRGQGPYPVLALSGEHGSAKSTTARVLRRLIDPHVAVLRTQPRDTRDLMIAASNSWVVAYDNLGVLPPWLSDVLCMISTGGGLTTRALYTDDEETVFDVQRPIVLTSIEDVVGRSDLADRTLLCVTPQIEAHRRQDERHFWRDFDAAWPSLLGALLDGVVHGLRHVDSVRLPELPRMADFAHWGAACEGGLGLETGTFLRAYDVNRESSIDLALENEPVAAAVRSLLDDQPLGEDTATELLRRLNDRRRDEVPPRGWPQCPRSLAAALRRAVPDLRSVGIDVSFRRESRSRRRLILISRISPATVPTVPKGCGSVRPPAEGADCGAHRAWPQVEGQSDVATPPTDPIYPPVPGARDDGDEGIRRSLPGAEHVG